MPRIRFGKYELITLLGRGGMADAYVAVSSTASGFRKVCAIKRVREEREHDTALRALMLEEARVASRLEHANVVQTFEVGEVDGQLYLAMELLRGQPLHRVSRAMLDASGSVDPRVTARIVADALAGLHYAHELREYDGRALGLVHRDVSPHNVFVTYDGQVKVLDFGIAKLTGEVTPATEDGLFKGKLTYMAPEQASGAKVDRRADVYAAGVVLWELLAGESMHGSSTPAETLNRLLNEPVRALSTKTPTALVQVAYRALEKSPDARFPTALAMREELEAWLETQPPLRGDDLGKTMTDLFARDLERLEKSLHDFMQQPYDTGTEPSTPVSTVTTSPFSSEPRKRPYKAAVGAALVLAAAAFALTRSGDELEATPTPVAASTPTPTAPLLRLMGSNTVGAELAPALAQAFLAKRDGSHVERRHGADGKLLELVAQRADGSEDVITLRADGTATAFGGLAGHECDIGMASRQIKAEELALFASDLRSPATEHVLALDGIAVILQASNPVRTLELAQLRRLFSGEALNWKDVAGGAGDVHVYARDDRSGTFDTFKTLVLGGSPLAASARRFDSSDALSDAVAADRDALGFTSVSSVRNAQAVALAQPGSAPIYPTTFTVATEAYPLSRRLFLYTLPDAPLVAQQFVHFALSSEGQKIVREVGFVDLDVTAHEPEPCAEPCPARYRELTQGARRLSLDFRFRVGSTELDSKATRDFDRLLAFLRQNRGQLRLIGFSDSSGARWQNVSLSTERARSVANELAARGVTASVVTGLGGERPVASNDDDVGREKNRRVELWLY